MSQALEGTMRKTLFGFAPERRHRHRRINVLHNQEDRGVQSRIDADDGEIAPSDNRAAPVEESDVRDTVSPTEESSWADKDNIYGGARLLRTPGKDVKAAREATLR